MEFKYYNTIEIDLFSFSLILATEAEYFYLDWPIYGMIICNVCLFVLTTIKLIQHKRKIHRQLSSTDSKRHDDNKLL